MWVVVVTLYSRRSRFSLRQPDIYVSADVSQLLAYPFGRLMENILPKDTYFNTGPFNRKEHMLITIMVTVAFATPFSALTVITQALPVYVGITAYNDH